MVNGCMWMLRPMHSKQDKISLTDTFQCVILNFLWR